MVLRAEGSDVGAAARASSSTAPARRCWPMRRGPAATILPISPVSPCPLCRRPGRAAATFSYLCRVQNRRNRQEEARVMSCRFRAVLSVVVVLSLSIWGQVFAGFGPGAQAGARAAAAPAISLAGTPELSTSSRLQDRREVAAGTRAYSIGFEDGRFYANGWHITGEMGGVWTPPLKLVDGVWFGLDGQWVGPATKFSSGWGYTRYDLPDTAGLKLGRTDRAPDGRRGVLFGLKITNPVAARTGKLSVDAHSELMGQYPWVVTGVRPEASDNIPDKGSFDGQSLVFTDDGALPGAPTHHYAALVGTALKPDSGVIGDQIWRAQPGHRCTGTEPGAPAEPKPSQCDDGPFGRV